VLDGGLLSGDAKVGDVLRVEAEFEIDGISIIAVIPSKPARKEPERLQLVPADRPFDPVVTRLAERRSREGRDRRPRRDGEGGDRARDRDRRGPRPDRPERTRTAEGGDRAGDRPGGERRPRREGEGGERRPRRAPQPAAKAPLPPKPKPKRLRPGRAHRQEVLASLPEEQRPVAEQVLRGGIPAVRAAVEEQNSKLRAEGKPEIRPDALLALAEELLPRLRVAEWLDRAEAALADRDEVDLRDLRSVVSAAADVARDETTRDLAARLREALNERVDKEHADWLQEVAAALDEGRAVRALRLSSRPPKAGSRFPADLAGRLAEAASASLTPEASGERWVAVLDALSLSPVRSFVVPAGLPSPVPAEVTEALTRLAPTLPEIAALFGIEAPAGRARPPRRSGQARRHRGGRGSGGGAAGDQPPAGDQAPTGDQAAAAEAPATTETETEAAPPADVDTPPEAEPAAAPPESDATTDTGATTDAEVTTDTGATTEPAVAARADTPPEEAAATSDEPSAEAPREAEQVQQPSGLGDDEGPVEA